MERYGRVLLAGRTLDDGFQEEAGRNDLCVRPRGWEVSRISSHEEVGVGCLSAFEKYVVGWVGAGADLFSRLDPNGSVANGSEGRINFKRSAAETRPSEDLLVFGEDRSADAELDVGLKETHQEYLRRRTLRSK